MTSLHIGKNVRTIRDILGKAPQEIADILGIPVQHVLEIEDSKEVDDRLLQDIANVLKCPVNIFKSRDLASNDVTIYQQNANDGTFNFTSSDKVNELYEKQIAKLEKKVQELEDEVRSLRSR